MKEQETLGDFEHEIKGLMEGTLKDHLLIIVTDSQEMVNISLKREMWTKELKSLGYDRKALIKLFDWFDDNPRETYYAYKNVIKELKE